MIQTIDESMPERTCHVNRKEESWVIEKVGSVKQKTNPGKQCMIARPDRMPLTAVFLAG